MQTIHLRFMPRIFKYFIQFVTFCTIFLVISLIAFFSWIYLVQTSIPFLPNIVKFAFLPLSSSTKFTIDSNYITSRQSDKIEVTIKGMRLSLNDSNEIYAEEVKVGLDLYRLLKSGILIDSISAENFNVKIDYDKLSESTKLSNTSKDFLARNQNYLNYIKYNFLKEIDLKQGEIYIRKDQSSLLWRINSLKGGNVGEKYLLNLDAEFENKKTELKISLNKTKNDQNEISVDFKNIPFFHLHFLPKEYIDIYANLIDIDNNITFINGTNSLVFDKNEDFNNANISFDMTFTPFSDKIVSRSSPSISSFETSFNIFDKASSIKVNKFIAKFSNGGHISSNANISRKANYKNGFGNDLSSLYLAYELNNIPVEDINFLWPAYYEGEVRSWIIKNISQGKITSGKGEFNLDNDFFTTLILKKSDVDASLTIENASLEYYEDFPKISNINGEVKFNGEALNASIKSASILNSTVNAAKLELNYTIDQLKLGGNVKGPIADFYSFIPDDYKAKLEKIKIDLPNLQYNSVSNVKLNMPLNENFTTKPILVNIDTKFSDVILSQHLKNFPIQQGNISIIHGHKGFLIAGHGKTGLTPFEVLFSIDNANIENNKFRIIAKLDNQSLVNLGLEDEFILEDNKSLQIRIDFKENEVKYSADLTNDEITIVKLGYNKPKNSKLSILATSSINDNEIDSIANVKISGDNISANGKIDIDKTSNSLKSIILKIPKVGNNSNIDLYYFNENNTKKIILKAQEIDMSNGDFTKIFGGKNLRAENKIFTFKIDRLLMKNEEILSSVIFNYNCLENFTCKQINFNSNISDASKLSINLEKTGNKEVIKVNSDNGSAFFRAFGVYKNLKKGNLEIIADKTIGETADGRKYIKLDGNLQMTKYSLTKQSFVTKLLFDLTSVPGILDAFSGGSMPMKEYYSKINYEDGVLNLDGRLVGNSIQITLGGVVDINTRKVKIKGSIIPSLYGINTNIGKIPLLGTIITGGTESAIAANYSVSGTTSDPVINLNPLTLLPIGFLKKIFE